jgi:hypothetical protein
LQAEEKRLAVVQERSRLEGRVRDALTAFETAVFAGTSHAPENP